MDSLIVILFTWLSNTTSLPATDVIPAVELASPATLSALRYGGAELHAGREVVGLYVDETRTILLSEDWDAGDPADVSALVHELVHHVQNVAGITYWCSGEREAPAYAAQAAWLAQYGLTLEDAFEIDPLTLKLTTACFYP